MNKQLKNTLSQPPDKTANSYHFVSNPLFISSKKAAIFHQKLHLAVLNSFTETSTKQLFTIYLLLLHLTYIV